MTLRRQINAVGSTKHGTTFTMTAGRRQRPNVISVPRSESVAEAKTSFKAAVSRGMTALKNENGYSHERATSAVLRKLSGGDIPGPSDAEVFSTMTNYRVGFDKAVLALTISKALKYNISENAITEIEAIDNLTSKLSLAELTELTSFNKSQSSSSTGELLSPDTVSLRHQNSGVRINPPATKEILVTLSRPKVAAGRKLKFCTRAVKQKSKVAGPAKSIPNGRKRLIDETIPLESTGVYNSRDCPVLLSDDVKTKIAGNQSPSLKEDPMVDGTGRNACTVSSVLSKLSRVEDSDACLNQPPLKRTRSSDHQI